MENEFPTSRGLSLLGAGRCEKSALVEAEKDNFPIDWMFNQLGVVNSSFCAWRDLAG